MRVPTGGQPSGAAIQDDCIWFCDSKQNAIRRMTIETKSIETVITAINAQPLNQPTDLQFDSHNNLIFSCPGSAADEEPGYVAVLTPQGLVDIVAEGLAYPNGLAFYPDTRTLLIAETHRQRIWQGFWNADELSWETIRVWSNVIDAPVSATIPYPGGMANGPDGNLYVAVFGAGLIRVLSAEGEFIRDISLPGLNPTNCIFDPKGVLGLVVTESQRGELLSITF